MGITQDPQLQIIFFVVFLLVHLVKVVGNVGMITLIITDTQLHTPMCFVLCNLSFINPGCSSAIAPRMLADFLPKHRIISFSSCATPLAFFLGFVDAECYVLAAMAYYRFVAICQPVHYSTFMSKRVCLALHAGFLPGWSGYINEETRTWAEITHKVTHFNELSCLLTILISYLYILMAILRIHSVNGSFNELSCLLTILISYLYILMAILRIHSVNGRYKAFSTCASHLLVVTIFFGTILFMYLHPSSSYAMDLDKVVSVFHTVVIPMLNPLIYSLRNKEVKISLVIYMITVFGNLGMILLIKIDSHLHMPMYFFLSNLSLVDFCYSSVIAPNKLVNFWTDNLVISFNECATQFFFFGSFAGIEGFLLTVVAYDHYVAICKPFLYTVTMSPRLNVMLVFNELSCLLTILISYLYILMTILRIHSVNGQYKAFSTCASHLMVVTIFFGTILFMYLCPSSSYAMDQDKVVSVFHTVVIPMLNPLIYSLRNKEVKISLGKIFKTTSFCFCT
ncbi:Olfactory receptor 5AR1 [Camelus dromedarius]|uniref:Olfactory receptor 5AR1 n=1 Tax=Camelus dromedarius TaxID=9838 RepID=A0A5N4DLU5_CAMDR|nr:Olfactory receptor 5AR1 [Camelus dromedarius]